MLPTVATSFKPFQAYPVMPNAEVGPFSFNPQVL